ncbi:MAG TPA: four helix bundle protein [Terriglobales bacterium]|nr:four helix bundle protein [Terriglobales bacterium]
MLNEEGMTVKTYADLVAWQKAIDLVLDVYRATRSFPKEEAYGLTAQVRRAAVSVPSNIAEGQGRGSTGEFLQFIGHAKGSLFELETQLTIAGRLEYLHETELARLLQSCSELGRIINGLLRSLRKPDH